MASIVVIFDSATGRTLGLARAIADGAGTVAGARVTLARIPSDVVLTGAEGMPVASAELLAGADGIAIGTPVHLGAPSAAVMAFLASTGALWQQGALEGRVATAFAGAGSGGGSETALATLWSVMAVHGLLILPGAPRATPPGGGGSPFGAVALAGSAEAALANEMDRARAQGARLARVAQALAALH